MAGPVLAGSLQVTVKPLPVTSLNAGASGAPGASITSATVTWTATAAVRARAPIPPVAVTVRS